jgi:hypothetical protein
MMLLDCNPESSGVAPGKNLSGNRIFRLMGTGVVVTLNVLSFTPPHVRVADLTHRRSRSK